MIWLPLKGGATQPAALFKFLLKACYLLVIFCALFSLPALADDTIPPSPIVKTALIVSAPLVKAGQPIDAGVTFTIPEHWHIYWRNPGDSGIPTTLAWTLPDGIKAGEIEWPAPERIETSGLVNYGYSNLVTLPVKLIPTKNNVTGEISVKASWLVCKEVCVPESANLTALLKADDAGAKTIAAARALVPQPFDGNANFDVATDAVTLTINQQNPWQFDAARFSPVEDGIMANNPPPSIKEVGNELSFTFPRGTVDAIATWHGVLHITRDGKETAWDVTAKNNAPVARGSDAGSNSPLEGESKSFKEDFGGGTNNEDTPHQNREERFWLPLKGGATEPAAPISPNSSSFILSLALAFLGGLILNIMPCVLPILALKALALSKKSQASRRAALKQGVSYTAGVVVSFLLIAGVMLALKESGAAIGWGFQLQNAGFVAFLIAIMLLVAANLLGLFHLPILFGRQVMEVNEDHLLGSFFTGVLAVMVATPCTAPFMATAIGATLALPAAQALAVFAALGFGMASPFLLISIWPAARRLLPKPGAWMHRFKQLLAIPMLATAAWLIFVLVQLISPSPMVKTDLHEAYSAARLSELRAAGTPVLVDATAAWCLSCKVNERVAINPPTMQQFFREHHVVYMVADWTKSDPKITQYLASFNRNGVPLYVYYPPHGEPVVLPQILTPGIVQGVIDPKK